MGLRGETVACPRFAASLPQRCRKKFSAAAGSERTGRKVLIGWQNRVQPRGGRFAL